MCVLACKRGNPQYSAGAGPNSKPVQCTSNAACQRSSPQQFQCTSIGAKQYCCPATGKWLHMVAPGITVINIQIFCTEYVCGNYGGRAYVTVPPGYDAGGYAVSGETSLTHTRWFYNSVSKVCEMVNYKGHAGNFNSFHTQQECSSFCAKGISC